MALYYHLPVRVSSPRERGMMPQNIRPRLRITRAETRGVNTNDQLSGPVTITIMRPGVMDLIYQFMVGGNFLSFGVSNTNCQSTKQSL